MSHSNQLGDAHFLKNDNLDVAIHPKAHTREQLNLMGCEYSYNHPSRGPRSDDTDLTMHGPDFNQTVVEGENIERPFISHQPSHQDQNDRGILVNPLFPFGLRKVPWGAKNDCRERAHHCARKPSSISASFGIKVFSSIYLLFHLNFCYFYP